MTARTPFKVLVLDALEAGATHVHAIEAATGLRRRSVSQTLQELRRCNVIEVTGTFSARTGASGRPGHIYRLRGKA